MNPIITPRLTLRQWRKSDEQPFYQMCSDSEVMRYFPATLSKQESSAAVHRFSSHIDDNQFGFWAAELTQSKQFIGFVGLQTLAPSFEFSADAEIGWRLASNYWGQGLATEGAMAALKYGFENRHFDEIVSMTVLANAPSERVMQRIGMTVNPKSFAHPKLPLDHPFSMHVLYHLTRRDWLRQNQMSAGL